MLFRSLRFLGGRRSLGGRLSFCWASLPLLPIAAGAVSAVMLLGRQTGHAWALRTAEVLRSTMFWQLAFWEWLGLILLFGFFFLSVLWLPEHAQASAPLCELASSGFDGGRGAQSDRGHRAAAARLGAAVKTTNLRTN